MNKKEFFAKYGEEVRALARKAGWLPRPGGSSEELDLFLCPGGFASDEEDERAAELFNALQYRRWIEED